MTAKRYDVIDKEEPRGQSVTYDGVPCTARHCCTNLNRLTEENEQLKTKVSFYKYFQKDARELEKKNEQLKQRNNRQAKRLAKLYELIAKKDWESLTEIIDDFKRCEEQLQREWRIYE